MLYTINSLADPLIQLLADDPVRPEIPWEFRVGTNSEIFVLRDDNTHEPQAVVCVCYRDFTPAAIVELAQEPRAEADTAVFYTIWSYSPGAARRLITQTVQQIRRQRELITEFVTLSPPTDMARQFHIRNGAQEWRVNSDSINYLYSSRNGQKISEK